MARHFSTEMMRQVNKFRLYYGGDLIFSGITDSGFNMDFGLIDSGSMLSLDVADMANSTIGQAVNVAAQSGLIGTDHASFAGLSFATKNLYKGTKRLCFTINSYLVLKEDYLQDIEQPLKKLMEYFLPKQKTQISIEEGLSRFNSSVKEAFSQKVPAAGDATGQVSDFIQSLIQKADKIIGKVYEMELPIAYKDLTKRLTVQIGRFTIPEVTVKNIICKVPPPIYRPADGGKPLVDHVDIAFTIETLRPVHQQTIDWSDSSIAWGQGDAAVSEVSINNFEGV